MLIRGRAPLSIRPASTDPEEAEEQLNAALLAVEPLLTAGDGPVRMTDKGELVINRLSAEQIPDEVEQVKLGLVDLLPRAPITELLIEVDRWTGFSDHLTHASGKTTRDNTLRQQLHAAILATVALSSRNDHGCDLLLCDEDSVVDVRAQQGPMIEETRRLGVAQGRPRISAAARARGRTGGRKPKMTPALVDKAQRMQGSP